VRFLKSAGSMTTKSWNEERMNIVDESWSFATVHPDVELLRTLKF